MGEREKESFLLILASAQDEEKRKGAAPRLGWVGQGTYFSSRKSTTRRVFPPSCRRRSRWDYQNVSNYNPLFESNAPFPKVFFNFIFIFIFSYMHL